MNPLRVWAPRARNVAVALETGRHSMKEVGGGFWELEEEVPAGATYAFLLDGGPPLPDPRAARLPQGVDGPAMRVDFADFVWTDDAWVAPALSSAVLYELHIGTFSARGNFDGAIARLDSLVELGVTHVEVMPVHSFPGPRGWGYDGVGLFAPHEPYGGPAGLVRFVDAAHARGLAVILDVVFNHLGPSGNHIARFGPYFTDRYETPWGDAVNLDGPESDEVRRFFLDNALQWLRDYHIDGLRLDAVDTLHDQSALHFLEELRGEVDALATPRRGRRVLIAESDANDPRTVTVPELGGYGMDAQWNDDFHHALHALLTGERWGYYTDFGTLGDVAKAFESAFVYDGRYSAFRRRRHGRSARGTHGHRFVVFLQSHDQVGNRARGERSSALMDLRRQQIGAALVLLSPFVPMLFQGEEWGARSPFLYFTAHADPELGGAIAAGRADLAAREGADVETPDPQDPATFRRSVLDWSEARTEPHASLREWHRSLIALRRAWPDLCDGRLDRVHVTYDESVPWLCVARDRLQLVCHLGARMRPVPIEAAKPLEILLASDPAIHLDGAQLVMPPDSVAVLRVEPETGRPRWKS